MGVSEVLGGFYSALEERFFGAMDFLSDKGVPVYSLIDPLEEHGVPALPVALAAIAAIALLAYAAVSLGGQQATINFTIADGQGNPLTGVSISATNANTNQAIDLGSTSFQNGQSVKVPAGIGTKLYLRASKDGYEQYNSTVFLNSGSDDVSVVLQKQANPIEGIVRLVDSQTNDPVGGARVTAELAGGAQIDCTEGGDGNYSCPGVIEGQAAGITVSQGNYEQKSVQTTFTQGNGNELRLTPKAEASTGTSNLIVNVHDADTKQPVGSFHIMVYDAKDNGLISDVNENMGDGRHVEKISKGTSVRIVVSAGNYLTYDSGAAGESITLRSDEEDKDVYLKQGRNALTVGVIDATGRPLSGVQVLLFNGNAQLIDSKDSGLDGDAVFTGLASTGTYYASAWQDGFIPVRQEVDLSKGSSLNLVMQRGTAANSGTVTVYTVDSKSVSMNGAKLDFYEDVNGQALLPLGIPEQQSDVTGKYSFLAPLGSNVVVKASKDTLTGENSVRVVDTFKNDAIVALREPFSDVAVKVLGPDGKEASGGYISIVGGNSVLLETEYVPGGMTFNPKGNSYVQLSFTTTDDNAYTQEVYVKDQNSVTVSLNGTATDGTTPVLQYLGAYTVDGTKVRGISKGKDYFLEFRAVFPADSNSNGIHVRLGPDNAGFADSQDAGITGFSAVGAGVFYGRSYSPQPSPGFEGLDFQNSGSDGQYNKWIELYFRNSGEKLVKVRVKAKETAQAGSTELHYRAWSVIGNNYYRAPVDPDLGLEAYSASKTGLYAQTSTDSVKILGATSGCSGQLCASYKFVNSDGTQAETGSFRAIRGNLYALDVTLAPSQDGVVTVKASTPKTGPKVFFQGYSVGNQNGLQDNNSEDTSIEADGVPVSGTEPTDVMLYFKAGGPGGSSIALQAISGSTIVNQAFYFSVYEEKNITLTTVPQAVTYGKDFVIVLQDGNSSPIENAQVKLAKPGGGNLLTIKGNGSYRAGLNGRYPVKNAFNAGTISYEVTAEGYRALDGTINVSKAGIVQWAVPSTTIIIPKGSQNASRQVTLSNNSNQSIQNMTFDVQPIGSLPDGMSITVQALPQMLPNTQPKVTVTAQYTGSQDGAHGEALITMRGKSDSGYFVADQTKVAVDYNPVVSPDCLQFSKDRLTLYLASGAEDQAFFQQQYANYNGSQPYYSAPYNYQAGYQGNVNEATVAQATGQSTQPSQGLGAYEQAGGYLPSNYYQYAGYSSATNDTFTAKLSTDPSCQASLNLKAQATPNDGQLDTGISVTSSDITLSPPNGQVSASPRDSQVVTVNATNGIIRNYPSMQKFSFNVAYSQDGFTKTMPVDVYIWNPAFALDVSRNVELFLGPNDRGNYSAQVPLFVRNVGQADIENVQFRVSSTTSQGNVDVRVVPGFAIQLLRKGDEVFPPQTLVAQVIRNEKTTLLDVKQLGITGVIDGTTYDFGPVTITSHVSSANCLTAIPGNISFVSAKAEGSETKALTLRNNCAEPVRVVGMSRPSLGNNTIGITPTGAMVPPGAEAQFTLVLTKGGNYSGPQFPAYIQAFLPASGTPIESSPIILDLKVGPYVAKGTAAMQEISMPVCEGGTKTIRLPVIASGNSALCDSAYCDAEQLANYLVDRAQEKIRDAEKQMQTLNYSVANALCTQGELARGYCSFDDLGVKNGSFVVYMNHDNISPAIVQKAIDGKNGTVKDFRADFFTGKSAGEYLGGYSKQLYMNSNFRGCGQYMVKLNGSVAVQGNRLVPDLMNIVIDITPDDATGSTKTVTEQCQPNIENLANFLPRDDGLTMTRRYDTWLGVATPKDSSLKGLSADLAKGLFGSDQRSVTSDATSTNTLKLDLGNPEGYVVKLQMNKASPDNPMTVNAYVRNTLTADKTLQKEILIEASQAIKDVTSGTPQGCIGADESYMLLKGGASLGQLGVKVDAPVPVQYSSTACTDVNVSSKVKETIALTARKYSEFDGLNGDPFYKRALRPGESPDSVENVTTVTTSALDPKTNTFTGSALICTAGNGQFQQANGKQVVVSARRTEGEDRKPTEVTAQLQVCGIHPLDFLQAAANEQPSKDPYYATFIWKGSETDSLPIASLDRLEEMKVKLDRAQSIADGKSSPTGNVPPEVARARRYANIAYFTSCAAVSGATSFFRPTVGLLGGVFNIIFDCGVPWAYQQYGDTALLKNFESFISTITKPLNDALKGGLGLGKSLIDSTFSLLGMSSGASNLTALHGGGMTAQDYENAYVDGFLPAKMLQSAVRGVLFSGTNPGMRVYVQGGGILDRMVYANSISDVVTRETSKRVFDSPAVQAGFQKNFGPLFKARLDEQLDAMVKANTSLTGQLTKGYYVDIKPADVEQATQKAFAEATKDPGTLAFYNANRGDITEELTKAIKGEPNEAAADKLVSELKLGTEIPAEPRKVLYDTSVTSYGTTPEALAIQNEVQDAAIARAKASIPGLLDTDPLVSAIRGVKVNVADVTAGPSKIVPVPGGGVATAQQAVVSYDVKGMVGKVNSAIKSEAILQLEAGVPAGLTPTPVYSKLKEAFDGIIEDNVKADTTKLLAKAKPGIGGSSLLAIKNLLKEGAFGAAANLVGLKAYDAVYNRYVKMPATGTETRAQELQAAGINYYGITVKANPGCPTILNYRTYRVSITSVGGQKQIELSCPLTAGIPAGTRKGVLIQDCSGKPFEKQAPTVMPGLAPEPDVVPQVFRDRHIVAMQAKLVQKYFGQQGGADSIGTSIKLAVRNDEARFKAATGLNLEALVASIGIVESGFGMDSGPAAIFGCNLKERATLDVLNNAVCAKDKLASQDYVNACKGDAGCYLVKYNSDTGNQQSKYIAVNPSEFTGIYSTWAGFAWNAK